MLDMLRKGKSRKPAHAVAVSTPEPKHTSAAFSFDYRLLLVCIAMVIAVLIAYGQLFGSQTEFFRLDDGAYVVSNEHVHAGLTAKSIGWAFTSFDAANWHPLTWLSLQFDYELYGLNAGGFHLTNVLLHALNSVLLVIILLYLTKAFWPSAMVAALFALHPLHVESVAWISERKDVLSTLFWILTMGAYGWYVQRPGVGRYLLIVLSFALGLLAKPMVVTLPCVLLLLDYWPLNRFGWLTLPSPDPSRPRASLSWLLIEKIPLFLLSAAACVVTVLAQRVHETPIYAEFAWPIRFLNAALAYVTYLLKTFWPSNLAPIYSQPFDQFPVAIGITAAVALLVITLCCLWNYRRRPYMAVGWLWFLGTLVPVIGLVQVGIQTMADRYTYVPHIGLFILLIWALRDLLAARLTPAVLATGAIIILLACFVVTWRQALLWRDNIGIWEHAVAVTQNNFAAHDNLGVAMMVKGRTTDAIQQFHRAVEIEPKYAISHQHLGMAYQEQKRWPEAAASLSTAVHLAPHLLEAQQALVFSYVQQGKMEEALAPAAAVLQTQPDSASAHANYCMILLYRDKLAEAEREGLAALKLDPKMQEALRLMGYLRAIQGRPAEAETYFRATLQSEGRLDASAAFYLAWALQAQGKTEQARELYRMALKQYPRWPVRVREEAWKLATDPDPLRRHGRLALLRAQVVQQANEQDPQALDTLAAAWAEVGNFKEAIAMQRQALALAKQVEMKDAMNERLQRYEKGEPFREAVKPAKK